MKSQEINDYLTELAAQGLAKKTVARQAYMLAFFFSWVGKERLNLVRLNKEDLERFAAHVFSDLSQFTYDTQLRYFKAAQGFFEHLQKTGVSLTNPAAGIRFKMQAYRTPQAVLSVKEIQKVFAAMETQTLRGLRDRALMELLYATGIRRHEAAAILIRDIDFKAETLIVRDSKNKTDRLIPVHPRALTWVDRYIQKRAEKSKSLFLNYQGKPLSADAMHEIAVRAFKVAGIEHKAGCHILRHSIATHLLERGCDIRFIQMLLGHKKLSSTQIYTRVSIQKLKEIHRNTHPAGKALKKLSPGQKRPTAQQRVRLPQWKRPDLRGKRT